MKDQELIEALAAAGGISLNEAKRFIDSLATTIVRKLKRGESIAIPDLGIFELVVRKERTGRHPRTGKPLKIPAQTALHFRPAAGFKRAVNP